MLTTAHSSTRDLASPARFRHPFPWEPGGWPATALPQVVAGRTLTSSARPVGWC